MRHFEEQVRQAFHQTPLVESDVHMKETIFLARSEVCRRYERKRISFIYFLSHQIKFIGWKVWGMQSGIVLTSVILLSRFFEQDYLKRPQDILKLLFCLSVFVSMTALPLIYRSVRYQMQEMEAVTYFSSARLLVARLIIIGMGDISLLGISLIVTIIKTSLQTSNVFLSLYVPFLFVSGSLLFMIGHFSPRYFFTGSIGLCLFLIVAYMIASQYFRFLFEQSLFPIWMGVCALLIIFCIQQFYYILHRSLYTEMQVTF